MSVENSLSRLSSALKKLEKVNSKQQKTSAGKRGLPGQQDLFASGGLSSSDTKNLIKKIDHTIATVETMLQQERA